MSPTLRRRRADKPAPQTSGPRAGDTSAASGPPAPASVAPATDASTLDATAPAGVGGRRRTVAHSLPALLLRAAHPKQALLTATGLALAAAISGRPGREVGLVLATVLAGQVVLGWHNDLVDRRRDEAGGTPGKPIAEGLLDPGTAWFALICAVLLVVPLSVSNGVTAGCAYLASLAIGLVGNLVLRRGALSWLPWAAAYALYPAFLSYGGWAGTATGNPPEPVMVAVAALLGVGAHFLCALPGLVADHENGDRHLPLRIALKTGATRLLVVSLAWTVLALAGLLVLGDSVGLSR